MKGFIKNILWPTDFSREAQGALTCAAAFAKAFSAEITAVNVVPDFQMGLFDAAYPVHTEIRHRTDILKKRARARIENMGRRRGLPFKKVLITEGSASRRILEAAGKEKSDLIVMGRKGQSALERVLIGSVTSQVLRRAPVPVLVTRKPKRTFEVGKILVPTDFAKGEELERNVAWKLASAFGASLTLLYVLELHGHDFRTVDEMFDSVLKQFKRKAGKAGKGVRVSRDVTRAIDAAVGIEDYARTRKFDLIVMATCARGLGRFILGSTTEKIISSTDIPVFTLPPDFCG